MAFDAVTFDLSFDRSRVGDAGKLAARCYTVDGVTDSGGGLRPLSIGQLVMAICLARAAELEAEIIGIVEDLDRTSEDLELLSKIESDIVNCTSGSIDLNGMMIDSLGVSYKTYLTNPENPDPASGVVPGMGLTDVPDAADSASEQLITDIEAKMDSLNSFSQQTMIDLQSLTAKRDQSYDMISNILKSLNTTLLANVNNM